MKHLKSKNTKLVQLVQSDFPGRMIKLVILFAIYFGIRGEWADFRRGFNDGFNGSVSATPKIEAPSFNLNSIVFQILKFL